MSTGIRSGDVLSVEAFAALRGRAHAGRTGRTAETSETVADQCTRAGLPAPVAEHVFARPRRWAFDWAWPDRMLALEIEGGVFTHGRHTRGSGFVKDMAKYNAAACLGWRIVRCQPRDVRSGAVLDLIRAALGDVS